jgi:hypothetical protein
MQMALQLPMKMKPVRISLTMTLFLWKLSLPNEVVSLPSNLFFNCLQCQLSPGFKWNLAMACQKLELPEFPELLRRFLYDQIYPHARIPSSDVSIDACPAFVGKISVFYSASATFRAPSDPSGPRGMQCEYIRATPSWRKGHSRYDCVFVNAQPELPGMRGLQVARVFLFFFHLCIRVHVIHAPLCSGSLLSVTNQMLKQVTGWWNPMSTKMGGHTWL